MVEIKLQKLWNLQFKSRKIANFVLIAIKNRIS